MSPINPYIAKPIEICSYIPAILMQRHVLVDAKVRIDKTYPAGFMGIILTNMVDSNNYIYKNYVVFLLIL